MPGSMPTPFFATRKVEPTNEPNDFEKALASFGKSLGNLFSGETAQEKEARLKQEQARAEVDAALKAAAEERAQAQLLVLKLAEEERERRMDFVPDVSAVDTDVIEVDPETKAMLRSLDMAQLPGIVVQNASSGWKDSGKGGRR